uniref:heparosan-N-sulfate-glucuronate 5-epimerase n=1 Tax=Ciona savignyi TaxID=51511 RepID=H2YXW6_CIOSA
PDEPPRSDALPSVSSLECLINDQQTVQCLKAAGTDGQVYMPFDFIQNYFEVYGKMKHYDGYDRFEFQQSYAKVIYNPKVPYSYTGVFMTFDSYNVEARDRVKCISGITGVPLSTQWHIQGYYYGIQIAQFGMSHYSKELVQRPPTKQVYENAEDSIQVISIPLGSGAALILGNTIEHILSFDLKMITNGSLSVVLETNDKLKQYTIHYITSNIVIDFDHKSNIYYGLGASRHWRHIARDLLTDLKKGIGLTDTRQAKKVRINILKVARLTVRGSGFIDNITLSTSEHLSQFHDASQWIYLNQDEETGGWKNEVERRLEGYKPIPAGWISAMGQGQGMSVLSRAYHVFQNPKYIVALSQAMLPFTKFPHEGGVRAVFMDKYTWYEEYPTEPASFVLNGFMYSLIGLYDFKALLEDKFESYELVTRLYDDGMTSLKAMLPLYDGGSRTFYDLRHFMVQMPPNIARWDYHTTHISQLVLLYSVTKDPVFKKYIDSWTGYLNGKVAKHN